MDASVGEMSGGRKQIQFDDFKEKVFENGSVQREVEIRKKVMQVFCKQESDFLNVLDYNNYLEQVEDIVFDLVNNINVEVADRKISEEKSKKDPIIGRSAKRRDELLHSTYVYVYNCIFRHGPSAPRTPALSS